MSKNLEKRRRIMQRSIRLGHCICDPKLPCPCDLLKEKDVCLCAGEQLDEPTGPVRLTRLVDKAGCASKIDQATLKRVLGGLPMPEDPRVLVGAPAGDDAGVYLLDNGQALVQTVDVFAPCVDDPYQFGQIAAANSVSDVYAMGGRPLTALSIVGFPARELPESIMRDILQGGIDKMAEAGVAIIGGHSINDAQVKAGFAVTGLIDPNRIATNAAARPGDALVLTKPLGTGIVAFAAQIDRAPAGAAKAAAASMAELNRTAAELMVECGAHACTDVTGFGLMGHLSAMAAAAGVDVEIVWDDLPLLPGVLECAAAGIIPGSVERNRESSGHAVDADPEVDAAALDVCFDAQTSGGLLIAIEAARARRLVDRLHAAGVVSAAVIGRVKERGSGRVQVRTRGDRRIPRETQMLIPEGARPSTQSVAGACCPEEEVTAMDECCSPDHSASPAAAKGAGTSETQQRFQEFLKSANKPGALDAYTKQAIAISLSLLARCEPCLKSHIKKAREKGFTPEEIEEAAWLAISFGGAPLMMYYNEIKKTL